MHHLCEVTRGVVDRSNRLRRCSRWRASRSRSANSPPSLPSIFLAQPKKYGLTDAVRNDLTEVVEGYTGRCDETAACASTTAGRGRHRVSDGRQLSSRRYERTQRSLEYDRRAIPPLQISMRAAASTIPVANAAMQENSKISFRSLIIVASPVRLPPRAATEAHSRT
jgi:hypothetical protein